MLFALLLSSMHLKYFICAQYNTVWNQFNSIGLKYRSVMTEPVTECYTVISIMAFVIIEFQQLFLDRQL